MSEMDSAAMDFINSKSVFWCSTVLLQSGFLLKCLVAMRQCSFPASKWKNWMSWFVSCRETDQRVQRELDMIRCRMTRIMWYAACGISMIRVVLQQYRLLVGAERNLPEFDCLMLLGGTMGLMILWKPMWINPVSLDAWYVGTSILSLLCLFPASQVDARDIFNITFGMRIFFAVLTKRNWCWMFCTLLSSVQVLWVAGGPEELHVRSGNSLARYGLFIVWWIPAFSIVLGRYLLYENVLLKMGLQDKSMELGAVTSLLLVCYDAVVQVDEALIFTEDSLKLSSLLLQTQLNAAGLAGRSFLDFFGEDRDRVSKHFANSLLQDAPVMAMNADMVDSDQNHMKVELLHAQFRNRSNERCFLIGVREIQSEDTFLPPLAPLPSGCSSPDSSEIFDDLEAFFEVPSFDILALSENLQRLCCGANGVLSTGHGNDGRFVEFRSILDLSDFQGREKFNSELQDLVNIAAQSPDKSTMSSMSLNFLDFGEVEATFHLRSENDTFIGSLRLHLSTKIRDRVQVTSPRSRRPSYRRVTRGHGVHSALSLLSEPQAAVYGIRL